MFELTKKEKLEQQKRIQMIEAPTTDSATLFLQMDGLKNSVKLMQEEFPNIGNAAMSAICAEMRHMT